MIRNLACAKAQIIHTQLRDVNKKAVVLPDTPLSALIGTSVAAMQGMPNDEKMNLNDSKITSMLSTMSAQGVNGNDEHDHSKAELVKMVGNTVRRTIYLARNVALPIIDDVVETLDLELQKVIPATGVALTIQESGIVKLINNSTLTQVVEKYRSGTAKRDAPTVNVHKTRDAQGIYDLIKVGYPDFDDTVAKFLLPYLGGDVITKVYHEVFSADAKSNIIANLYSQDNQMDQYAKAIITLLIAAALVKDQDDDINMSAGSYDNAMVTLMRWCGDKIIQGQDQIAYRKSTDAVVISYPPSGSEGAFLNPQDAVIMVDPDTYAEFLNNGGTPEMIMGSFMVDRQTKGAQLIAGADSYVSAYNRTVTSLKTNTQMQELMVMQRVLQRTISQEIGNATSSEYTLDPDKVKEGDHSASGWAGLTLANGDVAQKMLYEHINKLNSASTTKLYETVREIILSIFFEGTDVRAVLDSIDALDMANEEDAQGVINLAVVDYVTTWVLEQIEIVDTGA